MALRGSDYGNFQAEGPKQMPDRPLHTNYSEGLWTVSQHSMA